MSASAYDRTYIFLFKVYHRCKAKLTLLDSPVGCATPANTVKSRLFAELVSDSLNSYAYAASIAGLSYSVALSWDGLAISAQGYNHKLPILLKKVIEELKDFKVDAERFEVCREQLQQEYKNSLFQAPYYQIGFYTSYLFSQATYLTEEKLEELNTVTPEDVQAFIPQLLRQFNTEILVHGNIQKEVCCAQVPFQQLYNCANLFLGCFEHFQISG